MGQLPALPAAVPRQHPDPRGGLWPQPPSRADGLGPRPPASLPSSVSASRQPCSEPPRKPQGGVGFLEVSVKTRSADPAGRYQITIVPVLKDNELLIRALAPLCGVSKETSGMAPPPGCDHTGKRVLAGSGPHGPSSVQGPQHKAGTRCPSRPLPGRGRGTWPGRAWEPERRCFPGRRTGASERDGSDDEVLVAVPSTVPRPLTQQPPRRAGTAGH